MPVRVLLRRLSAATVAFLAATLLALLFAGVAQAATMSLSASPTAPVVGETVVFTAATPRTCNQFTWTFVVDGQARGPSSVKTDTGDRATLSISFATAGTHTVRVTASNGDCGTYQSDPVDIVVGAALGGSILTDPDPPLVDRPTTLSAVGSGGFPPYAFAWDVDNDGQFDDGTTRTLPVAWSTTGPRTVRLRVRDAATPTHEAVVTRTVTVTTPPPDAPPPAPAPPCTKRLAFALSEITTDGCFSRASAQPERWETSDAIKLNGVVLTDTGAKF